MVNTQMLGVSKKYTYMKTVSILILVLISLNSCRQKAYNNFQVDECIKAYNTQVDSLEKIGEIEKAMKIMFDSIGACVEGLSLKNYSFKLANEEELNFSTINKPSIIKITASTCAPCIAEIPAINRIAEEFKDELKIIVLFQDNVHYVQKNRSKYSALIDLVPSAIRSENIRECLLRQLSRYARYVILHMKKTKWQMAVLNVIMKTDQGEVLICGKEKELFQIY